MSLQDFIVASVRKSTTDVFSTMLGAELVVGDFQLENGTPEATDGVMSFIGLAGNWAGTGSVSCSPEMACRVCSQMLMTESTAVDADVLDAVAELTNMIIGCVKTELEQQLGPLGLSIPTVVFGHNFRTKSGGSNEWIVARFQWDTETLVVKLCLAPTEKTTHVLPHNTVCALEV
jgi:chemotaxis protein CheX